ncbi:MAG: ATP-binding cassette domain-containing protein [Sedimenticola thiotaurini]|uniref:ATP-binding cassette domain-containing protein n=1 Tax=Sedimenticola thiotaurini TaxID=1543721 RepID=A0A558D6M9_9GAMM|nr:MAG: ATP-binding cassette domain-containing protein [Sedimenticola thiotaurini]
MAESVMQISILHKAFQQKPVLGKIQFELNTGETTVLFGPSGCGKSTLLRLLAGLDIEFEGELTHRETRLGVVFQEPRLLPWRTVYQNVAMVAPDKSARIEQLLEETGLQNVAALEASKLSLGMARRVALARALIIEPEALILDEPFVSLDRERASQLRLLLLDIIERYKLKALLVTHDPYEAVQLAHQILVMGGTPSKLQQRIPINLSAAERRDNTLIAKVVNQFFDRPG